VSFSEAELERYARQIVIPGVGVAGQQRLQEARVAIVGLGGLGAPAALYLAAAGVGHLTVIENDLLENSNLQRQVLYETRDVGKPKVEQGVRHLQALNPWVSYRGVGELLEEGNAISLLAGHQVVISCVDSGAARQVINRACLELNTPWVDGGVVRSHGMVMTHLPRQGPCYHCLHPEEDFQEGLTPAQLGVWGAAAGVIGSLQAMEALKLILGETANLLVGRMLWFDMQNMHVREVVMEANPSCPLCGGG